MRRLLLAFGWLSVALYPGLVTAAGMAPVDYIWRFAAGDRVTWFGEVISVRSYEDDHNGSPFKEKELVTQRLGRYYELTELVDVKEYVRTMFDPQERRTLRARKKVEEQYFVAVFRFPLSPFPSPRPLSEASDIDILVGEATKQKQYVLCDGLTSFVGEYGGKTAVYVNCGGAAFGTCFDVRFVDE